MDADALAPFVARSSAVIILANWNWNAAHKANYLTHCGLVTLCGDIYLNQHWLRLWLGAVRQQAITWDNFNKFQDLPGANELTHWGRVTHICFSKLAIIGSDNGLSPGRRQAIIWTNAGNIVNWSLGNKLQWNLPVGIFIRKSAFENVVCEMMAILSWPHWVNLNYSFPRMMPKWCLPSRRCAVYWRQSRSNSNSLQICQNSFS